MVFHGIPRLNGNVLTSGDDVSIAIGSDVLQVYVIGQPQGAGAGRYVLRVPLVQLGVGEPRPADRAVQGARATILCRKVGGQYFSAGDVTIGERGTITNRDLNCSGTAVTTTTLAVTTSTTVQGATTTTVTGSTSTSVASTTSTTIPATCGNGQLDAQETCGDPGTAGCASGDHCVSCRCEACPSVTLQCSEWVRAVGGAARRATLTIAAGREAVSAVELRWDKAQMLVDRVGAPAAAIREAIPSTLRCTIDQEQAAAICARVAAPGEAAVSIAAVEVLATPVGDAAPGSRLRVANLLDAEGQAFAGCPLPGGCCVTASDCDPSDACHQPPTCGADNRCAAAAVPCDDGDACTTDTCDATAGCRSAAAEPPETASVNVGCTITNVRDLLPVAEGLSEKAKTQVTAGVDKIQTALDAALAAPKPKKCKAKLSAAVTRTKALLKTVAKLEKKHQLGESGQALLTVLGKLRDRIAQAQQAAATFCGNAP